MKQEYEIRINGDAKTIPVFTLTKGHHITYDYIASLGGFNRYRMIQPEVVYAYPDHQNWPAIYPKNGELYPGETIKIVDRMIFHVDVTDRT